MYMPDVDRSVMGHPASKQMRRQEFNRVANPTDTHPMCGAFDVAHGIVEFLVAILVLTSVCGILVNGW